MRMLLECSYYLAYVTEINTISLTIPKKKHCNNNDNNNKHTSEKKIVSFNVEPFDLSLFVKNTIYFTFLKNLLNNVDYSITWPLPEQFRRNIFRKQKRIYIILLYIILFILLYHIQMKNSKF